jgi:hypothetical protein
VAHVGEHADHSPTERTHAVTIRTPQAGHGIYAGWWPSLALTRLCPARLCAAAALGAPSGRYRLPVAAIVPARTVHRQARTALGPGFAAAGFERLRSGSIAAWVRPAREQFIVSWVQPSRYPDHSGWYGTKFTIGFRCGALPAVPVNGPGFRFCGLLDDDGREQVRAVQNAIIRRMPPPPAHVVSQLRADTLDWYLSQGRPVNTPYSPEDDVWFRHRDTQDLAEWFRLLPALLPAALAELEHRLG